jgi:asparagine synthase (glutamine-hydrolysing)
MSRICAVWQREVPHTASSVLTALSAGLFPHASVPGRQDTVPGVGVAIRSAAPAPNLHRNQRVLLACDADLLNEAELTAVAGQSGQRASTAELLAALYERDGERFVERLRGAFAIVLWDLAERRLVAALDAFGMKRLVWYDDGKALLVSSRVDAVRAAAGHLEVNPRAVANVLNFSANLAPETIFTGVQRLQPGTILSASERETRTTRYWDMRYGTGAGESEADLARQLESVVERAVSAHCLDESIGSVGAFLSGGTDSSTVLGMMTRAMGPPVKAFSIGFDEPGFNELEYAEIAARAFGAEHHTYLVSAQDCASSLTKIVGSFDEPFGNSSAVATYFCARLAAEAGVRTLLAGDGGDELFGGNEWYATDQVFERYHSVPRLLRTAVIEPLVRLPIETRLTRKARGYIRRATMPGVERVLSFQFLRTHPPDQVFDGDFVRSLGSYTVLDIPSGHYAGAPARDHLDRLLYVDMKITIADNDLPKVTCASELAGVRTRFPFLDRSVAEFSGRIPARLKVKGVQKRYLFKRAFRTLLPSPIIHKKKHGFGIPVALWMRSDPRMRELTHDTLLSARAAGRGYFRRQFIEELLRRHDTGDDIYYGDILWTFLMLELWHRQVVDEPARALA